MSARPSTASPSACSGERYSGVPKITPAWVSASRPGPPFWGSVTLAMPKSRIFTTSVWPSRSINMTFSGLRSRWTTPAACACSSARSIWRTMPRARGTGMGPPAIAADSDVPDSSSIARNSEPSAVRPKSVTVMMFGWSRRLADSASRSKRRANSSLPESSGSRTLMARSRRIMVCSAR